MSDQIVMSDLLVDLSTEEQQIISGGTYGFYGRPYYGGYGRPYGGYGRPYGGYGRRFC
ncbi:MULTISPECIES: hypothetical protein [unclassified Nostoc]|uniref:hypothetical protein n=1 Tax=unclassified Nostoc TaxID=2593658 RepID=UPI001D2499F7|nr:hypothetical protein [Nostoc sp. JL34]MBN3882984.1 hypothetical protein [Nostoc sp. JL34]